MPQKAIKYFKIPAELGDSDAEDILNKMGEEQVSENKKLNEKIEILLETEDEPDNTRSYKNYEIEEEEEEFEIEEEEKDLSDSKIKKRENLRKEKKKQEIFPILKKKLMNYYIIISK